MARPTSFESLRERLERAPGASWPARLVHHGARVLVLIALALAVQLFFPVAPVPDFPILERGVVADEDIIAEVAFPILKSDDELAREREDVAAGVPPIFVYDESAVDSVQSRVHAFLAHFDSAAAPRTEEGRSRVRVRELLRSYGITPNEGFVDILRSSVDRTMLRFALDRAIETMMPQGIAATAALDEHASQQIRLRRGDSEQLVARDEVLTGRRFYETAASYLPERRRAQLSELQRLILIRFFEPSIRYHETATEAMRDRARAAVTTTKGEVLRGEKIVGAHEQVREAELERLRSYRAALAAMGRLESGPTHAPRAFAALMYNFFVLGIFGLLLYFYRAPVYTSFRKILMLAFLVLLLTSVSAVIGARDWPAELIPIALPALAVAVLWDGRMALIFSLVLSVLLAGQTPFVGMSVLFTCVMAGAAASMSVRVVRSRAQTWMFIAVIALAYAAAAITLGVLRQHAWIEIGTSILWGIGSSVISALVAMGTLPLFEAFTRVTTPQTLLELGDLNRPLLQRLRKEAPGTFAHSISVAGIAEGAARAIDADALLTRVGTYYHDVGKIGKPQYFIENQHQSRNPHDRLKPSTSASIVRNHVLEGLRLAEEHRLPDVIKAFIAEHHGTQHISFFYDQAQKQNPEAELEPAAYAYPGPRPQSKETAILMLADSVESAARVLQDPTPERIRELVDRIVEGKIADGQLEDTPLTFREIRLIKNEFVNVLSGMFHQRIDYPPRPEPAPAATGAGGASG
ncbi:MAG TPA: HDIG domain-containing protein [Longimicrobiales bacterium]|nr:HDIG domain-containing protein [Longimicrobiales bacterium]